MYRMHRDALLTLSSYPIYFKQVYKIYTKDVGEDNNIIINVTY